RVMPELKVMRLAPVLAGRFAASVNEVVQASRRIYRIQAVSHLASTLLSVGAVLVIVAMVGQRAVAREIALGMFVAYWTAAWRMRSVISHLSDAISTVLDAHFELTNVRDVLKLKPVIPNQGDAKRALRGHIELRNLSFQYPAATTPAIDRIS